MTYSIKLSILLIQIYSGRTEFQNTVSGIRQSRRSVQFERKPSKRYDRRQSHVIREKRKKEAEERKDAATLEGKAATKAIESTTDKIDSQQNPEVSSILTKPTSDDVKTENRKSGCEPLKTNNVLEEDPVLIPIPTLSSRSNSSATKKKSSTIGDNTDVSKPEFIVNGDGIGGEFENNCLLIKNDFIRR